MPIDFAGASELNVTRTHRAEADDLPIIRPVVVRRN